MTLEETTETNSPHIIVLGNEKGGVGKTTVSFHVIMGLLDRGYKVSSIDIDSRQRSLSNYLENRRNYIIKNRVKLPFPSHFIINKSKLDSEVEAMRDEKERFVGCLKRASDKSDFIVVDAPGNDTYMSRLAHSYADTLITPINDSFIDLNVLAKIDEETNKVEKHGVYSEMVWEAKINNAKRSSGETDWIVVRNRLSNLDAKNKRNMSEALENLSKRVGCRVADGFSERVIYRELFLKGLSLLDIIENETDVKVSMTHIAARQELRSFLDFLKLDSKVQPKQKELASV